MLTVLLLLSLSFPSQLWAPSSQGVTISFLCSSVLFELDVICMLFITFVLVFFPSSTLSVFMLNSYVILSSSVLIIMRSFCNSSQLASGMISQYITLMANSLSMFMDILHSRGGQLLVNNC